MYSKTVCSGLNILSCKSFQRVRVIVRVMNLLPTKTFLYFMYANCLLFLFVKSAAATRSVSAIFVKQLNLILMLSYVHLHTDPLRLTSVFMYDSTILKNILDFILQIILKRGWAKSFHLNGPN